MRTGVSPVSGEGPTRVNAPRAAKAAAPGVKILDGGQVTVSVPARSISTVVLTL